MYVENVNFAPTAVSPSARPVVVLAAACLGAAVLATLASDSLTASLGVMGTVIALAAMWAIAIAETIIWLRLSTPLSLGIKLFGPRDIAIAIVAGIVLSLAVPLLSMASLWIAGAETGTIETAGQLSVGIAVLGVLTAAVTEEVIYRAGAMGALRKLRAPTWVVLVVPALIFTATHWSWRITHTAFVVLPLGLALGALYLWRRSLPVNIVAHLIVDIPIVVLAAAGG